MSRPCPFFCENGITYKSKTPKDDFPSPFGHPKYVNGHNIENFFIKMTCPICNGHGTISDEDYTLYESGMRGCSHISVPDSELGRLEQSFRSDFINKGIINKDIAKELLEKFKHPSHMSV